MYSRLLCFTLCLIVLAIIIAGAQATNSRRGLLFRSNLLFRGGKKSYSTSSSKRSSSKDTKLGKSSSKSRVNESKSSKRGGGGRGRNKNKKMELVPWNSIVKMSKTLGIREKLEDIAKRGQSVAKDAYRRAKVMKSSAFEGMLLKGTWPGNEPVQPEILTEIVKYSVPAFKYSQADSDDDPYRMTLHKLWTKMCEKDWRTITKSLYILHCIARDSAADASAEFAAAIKEMSKARNPKKPDHKYFDLEMLVDVDENSELFEDFLRSYGTYIFYRSKTFTSKFEELKALGPKSSEKQVVAVLKKAQQCLSYAVKCSVVGKDQTTIITGQSIRLISADIRDLWKLFSQKLSPLLEATSSYSGAAKSAPKDIASLLQFHKDFEKEVKSYLSKVSKAFAPLRIKIASELDDKLAADKLESRLAELNALSGGFTSNSGSNHRSSGPRKVKNIVDDEDEEEDEDEDKEGNDNEDGNEEDDDADDGNDDDDDDEEEDSEDAEGDDSNGEDGDGDIDDVEEDDTNEEADDGDENDEVSENENGDSEEADESQASEEEESKDVEEDEEDGDDSGDSSNDNDNEEEEEGDDADGADVEETNDDEDDENEVEGEDEDEDNSGDNDDDDDEDDDE